MTKTGSAVRSVKGKFDGPEPEGDDFPLRVEIEKILAVHRGVKTDLPRPRQCGGEGLVEEFVHGPVMQPLPEGGHLQEEIGAEGMEHKIPDLPCLFCLLQQCPRPRERLFGNDRQAAQPPKEIPTRERHGHSLPDPSGLRFKKFVSCHRVPSFFLNIVSGQTRANAMTGSFRIVPSAKNTGRSAHRDRKTGVLQDNGRSCR